MDSPSKVKLTSLYQPDTSKPDRSSKVASLRRFKSWVESLPLGNMTAAGNQLLGALKELNQSDVAGKNRAEILDRIIEPVLTVVGVLDKHFLDTTFPLSEKSDRIGRVAVEFFHEIALGYRLAAQSLIGGGDSIGMLSKRNVVRYLHHSMAAREQMLYRLALLYQMAPRQVWREINTLYVFAHQHGLHGKSLNTSLSLGGPGSLEDLYLRASIMGISDPTRLSQRGIRALAQAVALWARRSSVATRVELRGTEPGLFIVDPGSDQPPLLLGEEDVPAQFDFVLDMRPLRNWLQEVQDTASEDDSELSFRDVDDQPFIIDRQLIIQLISTWGIRRERDFQRMEAKHEVDLLVGLNSAHFFIAGECPFARFLREYGDKRFATAAARERARFARRETGARPIVYRAHVLNQSLGGYRLRITETNKMALRVGELVGLCPAALADDDPVWMVGIIRWLHAIDVREIELGIAVIGQRSRPGGLLTGDEQKPPVRALVCEPFRADMGQRPFLVVPSSVTIRGEPALCVAETGRAQVLGVGLEDQIEKTSEIARYLFSEVARREESEESAEA
ncbi:MAG: hypothetical protein R3200_03650 [Xanthomonadales bacterium]|nr:hypothetical protein [Xanthomonadales bacterium]